jgi:hypothetical protein
MFFGIQLWIVDALNFAFFVLNIVALFFLTKLVFKSSNASLMAAALYAFFPLSLNFLLITRDTFISFQFFIILTMLFFFLALRAKNLEITALFMLLVSVTVQFRIEFGFLFILPLFLQFRIQVNPNQDVKKKHGWRRFAIVFFIVVLLAIPFFVKFGQRNIQLCKNAMRPEGEYTPDALMPFDFILSGLFHQLSLKYIWNNVASLVMNTDIFIIIFIFMILQILLFKKTRAFRSEVLVFLSIELIVLFMYISHCAYLARYDIHWLQMMILAVLILPSVGYWFSDTFDSNKNTGTEKKIAVLIVLLVVVLYVLYVYKVFMPKGEWNGGVNDVKEISERLKNVTEQQSVILVGKRPYFRFLRLLFNYQTYSFSSLIDEEEFIKWYEENRENTSDANSYLKNKSISLKFLPNTTGKNIFFIFTNDTTGQSTVGVESYIFELLRNKYVLKEEFTFDSKEFVGVQYIVYRIIHDPVVD